MARILPRLLFLSAVLLALGLSAPAVQAQANVHVVQEGDTLQSIAQRYGKTVSELRAMNNLRGDNLRVGQHIRVRHWGNRPVIFDPDADERADVGPSLIGVRPEGLVAPEPIPTGPPPPPPPPATITRVEIGGGAGHPLPAVAARAPLGHGATHTVRAGETLFSIARQYGTTVDALKRANQLRDDRIAVGRQLRIPGASVAAAPVQLPRPGLFDVRRSSVPDDEVHVVMPGETLFSIAARYGTTAGHLLELNRLTTAPLAPGTLLVLPEDAGRRYHRQPAPPRIDQEGLALIYPDAYIGRTTISGEPYDPQALTASHRELPFGTLLRVLATETGAQTLVRVNDRGPVSEGFLIELSHAAARALGLRAGVAHAVQVQVVR